MTRDELIHMVDGLDRDGGFAKALGQACFWLMTTILCGYFRHSLRYYAVIKLRRGLGLLGLSLPLFRNH